MTRHGGFRDHRSKPALSASRGAILRQSQRDCSISQAGQGLSNVDVQLLGSTYRSRSDVDRHFEITSVAPGDHTLQSSMVTYRVMKTELHVGTSKTQEFQSILSEDTLRRTDTVTVQAGSLFDSPAIRPARSQSAATISRTSPPCWRTIPCAPFRVLPA
jgi:hypothetical protein